MVGSTTDRLMTEVATAGDDANERSFLKWAGWNGLLGTLAFIVTIAMTFVSVAGPDGPDDVIRFLGEITDSGPSAYVYGIAGVVLVLLYIPLTVGAYRLLGRSVVGWYGSAAVAIGLGTLLPAYLINLLAPVGLAPLASELGGAGAGAIYVDYEVARVMAELFFTVGSVLSLAIGPLLWGVAWFRAMDSGRWIAWTGVLTGLTGMVWFVWLVDNTVLANLLIVNVLLSLVLFTGVSLALIGRGKAASAG